MVLLLYVVLAGNIGVTLEPQESHGGTQLVAALEGVQQLHSRGPGGTSGRPGPARSLSCCLGTSPTSVQQGSQTFHGSKEYLLGETEIKRCRSSDAWTWSTYWVGWAVTEPTKM